MEKAKLVIVVVPAGIRPDKSIDVVWLAVPEQVLLSWPVAHVFAAPANKGATPAAMAVVTLIPFIVVGALLVQLHEAGQFGEPDAAQFPVSFVDTFTVPKLLFHVMLICGPTFWVVKSLRVTLNVAVQPLAAVGAVTRETTTPVCGLLTVKAKLLIDVVPGGKLGAMEIALLTAGLPAQTRRFSAVPHIVDVAPGYRGENCDAIAVVNVPVGVE